MESRRGATEASTTCSRVRTLATGGDGSPWRNALRMAEFILPASCRLRTTNTAWLFGVFVIGIFDSRDGGDSFLRFVIKTCLACVVGIGQRRQRNLHRKDVPRIKSGIHTLQLNKALN